MGLLIMERNELTTKYEQMKASSETVEILSKRDQASLSSVLVEARKREEKLKKAIGVKDECIASVSLLLFYYYFSVMMGFSVHFKIVVVAILFPHLFLHLQLEKALHEMRAESAETKIGAESKLAEAKNMMEDAHKKFTEAEAKLHAAESLQVEASRYRNVAERKLQEVEAREDDLRRRIESFKFEYVLMLSCLLACIFFFFWGWGGLLKLSIVLFSSTFKYIVVNFFSLLSQL